MRAGLGRRSGHGLCGRLSTADWPALLVPRRMLRSVDARIMPGEDTVADESDFQLQNSAQAIEFAREAIRSGILINGGAAVAVLALLSGENTASLVSEAACGSGR